MFMLKIVGVLALSLEC